jgi:hypothetical protein
MKKYVYFFVFLIAANQAYTETPDELDMKVIGFCAVASLTTAMQNRQVCDGIAEICQMGEVIDTLDRDLTRSFAFVKRVRQVQLHHPAAYEGRTTKANGPETIVFVTEPISALDGGVLVFVSTTAPARVAIFFLDPSLKGELVYDSYVKAKYFIGRSEAQHEPIESIGRLVVDQKGFLVLTEFSEGAVSGLSRRFRISYDKNNHPSLQLIKSKER